MGTRGDAAEQREGCQLALADLEAFDPRAPARQRQRRFCCPLPPCQGKPRDAAHRSLVVEITSGLWYCHRCASSGILKEHWKPRPSRRQAERRATRQAFTLGPDGPTPMPRPGEAARPTDRSVVARASPGSERREEEWRRWLVGAGPIGGTPGQHYLAERGIPDSVAEAAGILFAPDFFGRPAVVFPIRDESARLVAVSGRRTDGRTDPKVHTAGPARLGVFSVAGDVFASERLVLAEAPIDALSLATAGQPALALNGLNWPTWLPRAAAFKRVIIAFDADDAGDRVARVLATEMRSVGAQVERWRPLGSKDWNDLLRTHGAGALRAALSRGATRSEFGEAGGSFESAT